MSNHRILMSKALKQKLVPELRSLGFKGSFPHFYRSLADRVDFLSVQFNSAGGSFVVEIAKSGPNGIEKGFGSDVPISKLNVKYFHDRLRLGAERQGADHWFKFGPRTYDPPEPLRDQSHYESLASSVISFLRNQGEEWWRGN